MKHIVMFSGGAGSWAAAKRVAAQHGTENLTLLFADTRIEDEDLYRFLIQAASNIGGKLVCIADGRTPWQVFEDERFIGNSTVDPCSKILKRKLLDRWRDANCTPEDTAIYVGLGWYEPHRVERLMARTGRWRYEAPMTQEPHLDPEQVLDWMHSEGVKPPRLYSMGFTHNNCGGFCVKAGQASFARLLHFMPKRYAEHEAHEARLRAQGINGTILEDRRGGTRKPMTLRDFRIRVEREGVRGFDPNDVGGCGCAIDDNEPAVALDCPLV